MRQIYFDKSNCSYCRLVLNTFETWLINLQTQDISRWWGFQSKVNIFIGNNEAYLMYNPKRWDGDANQKPFYEN